jgi:hypothetical protein
VESARTKVTNQESGIVFEGSFDGKDHTIKDVHNTNLKVFDSELNVGTLRIGIFDAGGRWLVAGGGTIGKVLKSDDIRTFWEFRRADTARLIRGSWSWSHSEWRWWSW